MGGRKSVPERVGPFGSGNEELAHATVNGDIVTLHNCRDSTYSNNERLPAHWRDLELDVGELTNLWVYFVNFSKIQAVAHSELCFEFADGTCLIASFEARMLKGQRYGIITGMGKNFEMTLRWITERDALTRRLTNEENMSRTYMFEADITHGRVVDLFRALIERTNELYAEPEWYNTVSNTCTTSIMDIVHDIIPGQVKRTPRVLLPGMLPKFWAKQGVLKFDGDFDKAFDDAYVTDRVREIGDVPDLSMRLHQRGPFRP